MQMSFLNILQELGSLLLPWGRAPMCEVPKNVFVWIIFKSIELVTILLPFYILVFVLEARGIFAPQPGTELTPPALKGGVLTTGLPGKSCVQVL